MLISEIKNSVAKMDRYSDFNFLEQPSEFCVLFKDRDIPTVQLHCVKPIGDEGVVGFCGAFRWAGGKITSLDGDSYYPSTLVYGYKWFETKEGQALDILVDEW